jgi:alkylation response protein AidB-like acyl-CoA dehydrogenase
MWWQQPQQKGTLMTITDNHTDNHHTDNHDTGNGADLLAELDDDVLVEFRRRAAVSDRENTYFHEDLKILQSIGYLAAAAPASLGGGGRTLSEVAAAQRRLARFAPATALATSMHHYWVGMAAELERFGDTSCRWILEEAVSGSIFAAGHAERGNDAPVVMSTSIAVPVEGGYRVDGHKMFGSNGPSWDFLGIHALDASDPDNPRIIHGFVPRDTDGVTVLPNWDTLGMRASQSYDTVMKSVFIPSERVARVVPAGSDEDLFLLAMNVWALGLMAHVYLGIADRAIELAVDDANRKTSVAIPGITYAYNPMIQHQIAEMALQLDAGSATAERLVDEWDRGVDHGAGWGVRIPAAKWNAIESAKRVVDVALDVTGGAGMFRGNELERLYRDVRCGGFHPANDALTHESIGKALLGIDPNRPRW